MQPRLETTAPENAHFALGELLAYPGRPFRTCVKVPLLNSTGAFCLAGASLRWFTAVTVGMLPPTDTYRKMHRRDSCQASVPRKTAILLNIQFFFYLVDAGYHLINTLSKLIEAAGNLMAEVIAHLHHLYRVI